MHRLMMIHTVEFTFTFTKSACHLPISKKCFTLKHEIKFFDIAKGGGDIFADVIQPGIVLSKKFPFSLEYNFTLNFGLS